MSQTSKIALAVVVTSIIVGGGVYLWQKPQQKGSEIVTQQPEQKTYSGNAFTVQYPSTYKAETDNLGVVTISGANGKIMIGDFEPAAAPTPTSNELSEQLPKDIKYHGKEATIASALFYKSGDNTTEKELESIQSYIKLK